MADKPAQIKKPKKKDKGITADSVNYPTDFELSSVGEKGSLPLKKSANAYANIYVQGIEDDKKKTTTARKRNSISRLEEIEKMQYKNADFNTKGKEVKSIAKIAEQNKKNKAEGLKIARDRLKRKNKPYAKKQQSAKAIDTGSTFAKGGRAGYKHGKYVTAEPNPHVDIKKYVTKDGKDDGKRYRVPDSEMKVSKKKLKGLGSLGGPSPAGRSSPAKKIESKAKGGRAGYSVGGIAMRGVSKILMKK